MRVAIVAAAEAVYNRASPAINGRGVVGWLLSPWAYLVARASGAVADWLDPIA
jgi:hypothetical protein